MKLSAYRITLSNLAVLAKFGYLEAEKQLPQTLYIDLAFTLTAQGREIADSLESVYDYSAVAEKVEHVFRQKTFRLLEDASAAIAAAFLPSDDVEKITITIRKPSAPIAAVFDHVESVLTFENE